MICRIFRQICRICFAKKSFKNRKIFFFFVKNQNYCQDPFFVKNQNFCQNRFFCQKSKSLSKLFFVCQKSKLLPRSFFCQKIKNFVTIVFFCQKSKLLPNFLFVKIEFLSKNYFSSPCRIWPLIITYSRLPFFAC
mgnify:CR=1 FL=1